MKHDMRTHEVRHMCFLEFSTNSKNLPLSPRGPDLRNWFPDLKLTYNRLITMNFAMRLFLVFQHNQPN